MPRQDLEYPREPHSTVKRYNHQAKYDLETIHGIVNAAPILHISFNVPDSPFPATLPMLGHMGSFDRPSADIGDVLEVYLHGYVSSRLINSARNSEKGLPVTVSASHIDGLCLTLTPNSHNLNYRSAVLFGYATVVDKLEEKLYAMEVITNGIIPDRWRNTRTPPNAAEMQSTSILRVKVTTGSGKVRTGSADLDKNYDLDDEDLVKRVWTGVIPMYTTLGEPVPRGDNRVTELPGYLRDFVKETNEDAKAYAYDAINVEVPKKKQDDDA